MDGFSLSVASYVVKVKVWKFNYKRMCKNQRKSWPFLRKRPTFVELLTRFELVTSSLPTDCKLGNRWYPAVSGPFCSGKMMLSVLSTPLILSASFPVWVRLWVKPGFRKQMTDGHPTAGIPAATPSPAHM